MIEFLEIVGFGLLWFAWFGGGVLVAIEGRFTSFLAGLFLMLTCAAFFAAFVM